MAYKFRTPGPWGPGQSEDLDPVDVDNNFWQAIQDIAAKAQQGVGIANITVIGNQLTFVLTDHTIYGPFTLPIASIQFVGPWVPDHVYVANDIFTIGGSTYIVRVNHTSAATFDPGATDGHGNDLYGLLLQNPALTIPAGGAAGYFLRKISGSDYDFNWLTAALSDLSDVLVSSPIEGDVLTFSSGVWLNAQPSAGGGTPSVPVTQTRSGSTFTPALSDVNTYNRFTNSTGCTLIVPTNSSVAFPIDTEIHGRQASHSFVLIEHLSGSSVVINGVEGCLNMTDKFGATFTLKKVGTDEWDLFGKLAVGSP